MPGTPSQRSRDREGVFFVSANRRKGSQWKKYAILKRQRFSSACPRCQSKRIGTISTRGEFRCRDCDKRFSLRENSIFERSRVPLAKWLVAAWAVLERPGGITERELAETIQVSTRTAWSMITRLKAAARSGSFFKKRK